MCPRSRRRDPTHTEASSPRSTSKVAKNHEYIGEVPKGQHSVRGTQPSCTHFIFGSRNYKYATCGSQGVRATPLGSLGFVVHYRSVVVVSAAHWWYTTVGQRQGLQRYEKQEQHEDHRRWSCHRMGQGHHVSPDHIDQLPGTATL